MTARPRRLPRPRVLLLVAVGAVVTLVTVVAGPVLLPGGASRPAAAAESAPGKPATLSISSLTPDVATTGELLQVSGRVANTGRQSLRRVEVRLRLSATPLGSRAELAAVAAGRTSSRDGEAVVSAPLPDLEPGEATGFMVSRSLDDLDLAGFGVYALGVEVLAERDTGFGRVAISRTLLPWVPARRDFLPTGFSWLWPLASRPARLSNGSFADDTLAGEMAETGRLSRLLDAGEEMRQAAAVTWVVDPELLAAAADMADGYRVQAPDGSTVPGGGSGIAGLWLDRLRTVTAGAPVLALPYGDPDVVALDRHGRDGDVVRATQLADSTVADLLPLASPVDDVAWPAGGWANRATLGVLRRADRGAAVLDGRAVPPELDLSYTPAGRADLRTRSGRVAGLLADPGLADLLREPGGDPLLDGQRLLAETAMITSELPSTGPQRAVVVAPPRRWDPPADLLARIVASGRAPWTAAVPLRTLAQTSPPEIDRQPLSYPRDARRRELPAVYLRALDAMHTGTSLLGAILSDPSLLVPDFDRSITLLESTWWRGKPSPRANRLDREKDLLTRARTAVRVQPGNFTFSSRSGTIPVTVANELEQEVEVVLRLDPQTPRLRIEPVEPITIGPRSKRQVPVAASAVAGGPVVVDAQLHTPGGAAYGQPVPLRISITQYGTVALYITGVAAAVLFLAAGVRVLRRILGARGDQPPPEVAEDTDVREPVP